MQYAEIVDMLDSNIHYYQVKLHLEPESADKINLQLEHLRARRLAMTRDFLGWGSKPGLEAVQQVLFCVQGTVQPV